MDYDHNRFFLFTVDLNGVITSASGFNFYDPETRPEALYGKLSYELFWGSELSKMIVRAVEGENFDAEIEWLGAQFYATCALIEDGKGIPTGASILLCEKGAHDAFEKVRLARKKSAEIEEDKFASALDFLNHESQTGVENKEIKILIADDDPIILKTMRSILSKAGYVVFVTNNGTDALKAIEGDEKYDLVILDVVMPDVSGIDVCRKIRNLFSAIELPVMLLTGKNDSAAVVEGFEAGANDYLFKPVSAKEIVARIKTYIKLSQLTSAYDRFVPMEFLKLLGKRDILDVNLGDNVQGQMTIMFSDIRGFSTAVENMTVRQSFQYLNSYLSRVNPIISQNKGFIDKYIGDEIMAIFPRNTDDAVFSAISLISELPAYNSLLQKGGFPPIQIGIGLHCGKLILGAIGGRDRMEGTVISDAVNLAKRLETLTRTFGVNIIASDDALNRSRHKSKLRYRCLGDVRAKGKRQSVTIYEIYDGDPLETLELKEQTKELFMKGLQLFQLEKLAEANKIFQKIVEKNPADGAAKLYSRLCVLYSKYDMAEDWDLEEGILSVVASPNYIIVK